MLSLDAPLSTPEPSDLALPPAPEGAAFDLIELVLSGLAARSRLEYLADLEHFRRFAGSPSVRAALAAVLSMPWGPANLFLASYVAEMSDQRKLAPATIRRRVAPIRRAFRRARKVGLTAVILDVDLPVAENVRDMRGPSHIEWENLLDAGRLRADGGLARDIRNLALVLLLRDCALRRSEALAIQYPEDVDLVRGAVRIVGKGRREPKWITLNDRIREALARWVEARASYAPQDHAPAQGGVVGWAGPLWVGERHEPLRGGAVGRMLKTLSKLAKIRRTVRPHGLRHEAATKALDEGWTIRDVMGLTRHKDPKTLMGYDDARQDVGGRITRALGGETVRRRR